VPLLAATPSAVGRPRLDRILLCVYHMFTGGLRAAETTDPEADAVVYHSVVVRPERVHISRRAVANAARGYSIYVVDND